MLSVEVKALPHFTGLQLPRYETPRSAGVDLRAALSADHPVTLQKNERILIPTGLSIALPNGFEAQLRPRSGLAFHHGLTLLNSPGTIDADFRGEIKILLIHHGTEPVMIERGMRIAQMVITPVSQLQFNLVEALDQTARGSGGFGSTGVC